MRNHVHRKNTGTQTAQQGFRGRSLCDTGLWQAPRRKDDADQAGSRKAAKALCVLRVLEGNHAREHRRLDTGACPSEDHALFNDLSHHAGCLCVPEHASPTVRYRHRRVSLSQSADFSRKRGFCLSSDHRQPSLEHQPRPVRFPHQHDAGHAPGGQCALWALRQRHPIERAVLSFGLRFLCIKGCL